MEKREGYKIKLAIGQKSKWVKFMEGERKLKLRGETELHNNIDQLMTKYIRLCKVKIPKKRNLKIR